MLYITLECSKSAGCARQKAVQPCNIISVATETEGLLMSGQILFRIFFIAAMRPRNEVPSDGGEDDVRGFPDSTYCCIAFHLPLTSVNLRKALVASEGYHMVITSNITLKSIARRREERVEEARCRRSKRKSLRKMQGGRAMPFLSMASL